MSLDRVRVHGWPIHPEPKRGHRYRGLQLTYNEEIIPSEAIPTVFQVINFSMDKKALSNTLAYHIAIYVLYIAQMILTNVALRMLIKNKKNSRASAVGFGICTLLPSPAFQFLGLVSTFIAAASLCICCLKLYTGRLIHIFRAKKSTALGDASHKSAAIYYGCFMGRREPGFSFRL